jgi:anti-sigma-K factor RskA
VIVDRDNTRAYFVTADLPALEANRDYQLWYLDKSGRPVDGGVFQVDHSGYGEISVRNLPHDLSDITAFAVTIEPKGGSVNPTLDQMVLLGRV